MKRGDVVIVSVPGDYGKPRPAIVIQSDLIAQTDSVLVCLLTSTERATPLYRLALVPTDDNGLKLPSQIMTDKIHAMRRDRVAGPIGTLSANDMERLNTALSLVVGLADA